MNARKYSFPGLLNIIIILIIIIIILIIILIIIIIKYKGGEIEASMVNDGKTFCITVIDQGLVLTILFNLFN
jgi:hypothetical protein